ncbi:caveolae-associated protein 1-like [Megalops cyprinoides]|uniref:caveolae-associated protein 1-like n=1 Tax=Megalops cyprinoides TaxID=118141 RepID=UPI001863C8F0|nr:caveolae-associated protein 1-like [Megalops cyprinoides]
MADSSVKLDRVPLTEASDDDDEMALVSAVAAVAEDDEEEEEAAAEVAVAGTAKKSEAQMHGVMVLALLDKIIGVVDQIQQTQNGLEERQEGMEHSVVGIRGELNKLSKNHTTTANTVNKMLEKVRKVSVNVKTVRTSLEKQAGQIKRLESNEQELLKRRNFRVMIYQEEGKPPKATVSKSTKGSGKVAEGEEGEGGPEVKEEAGEGDEAHPGVSSDEEVEIEEIIEESRAERIKRSGRQQMDSIKKAFSKEKMEKTKQKTKENLEKTRLRTRENLEKTRHNLEKKMGKLGNRMAVKPEQKEKMKSSREKVKKSFTPDHTVYARSKTSVYKVPPFTFHVKKVREGEEEVQPAEPVEVAGEKPVEEAMEEAMEEAVERAEQLSEDGPEVQALLKLSEDSELVLVDLDHEKDSK